MGELSRKTFLRRAAVLAAGGATGALGYAAAAASERGKGRGDEMGKGHNHHPTTSATTTTGTRTWPASFYTGPLGQNNLLPTGPGAYLMSQFGGAGYSKQQERDQIEERQAAMGRTYDIIMPHYDGSLASTFDGVPGMADPNGVAMAPNGITQEEYAIANGSEICVTWVPSYNIDEINAGDADAIYAKAGNYWKQYKPHRIMLRIFHELDLPHIWGVGERTSAPTHPAYTGAEFIQAWQRMVTKITETGADNVGFYLCFWEGGLTTRTAQNAYYPGDTYVDWVGSDTYNFVTDQSTPIHAGWAEWWELFNYSNAGSGFTGEWSTYDIYGSGLAVPGTRNLGGGCTTYVKPFVVGETGSPYDDTITTRKGDWYRGIVQSSLGMSTMPNMVALGMFDEDAHAVDYDWRVDRNANDKFEVGSFSQLPYNGFIEMSRSPLLRGR